MWELLIKKIQSILTANSLLSNVYIFENADFEADPVATITPSANENAFTTTIENGRTYAFTIRLFKDRGGQIKPEDAEEAMRQLVDSVLDDLDKNWALSGMNVPTGYTFLFMDAAPSAWGYIDRETQLRVAEINVRCNFSIDTTTIS